MITNTKNVTLTTGIAAKLCGVTPDTVLKWIKKGTLRAFKTAGGHYRIDRTDLEPFIIAKTGNAETPSAGNESAGGGVLNFCWEYHSDRGSVKSQCRNCMVFRAKAERCYLLAGLGHNAGHEAVYCQEESCFNCSYFRLIEKSIHNVLIISDHEELKRSLNASGVKSLQLRFANEMGEIIEQLKDFIPDYIVIDYSMNAVRTNELSYFLISNPIIRGIPVIIAAERVEAERLQQEGVCASINLPFTINDLEKCILKLNARILGIKE